MTHTMNLSPVPFALIKDGKKTIELRLYDEKRRAVKEGDTIIFTNAANGTETLCVKVIKLCLFDSFKELYETLPLEKCGYSVEELALASPGDMDIYYSEEKQKRYGVVGIEISLI